MSDLHFSTESRRRSSTRGSCSSPSGRPRPTRATPIFAVHAVVEAIPRSDEHALVMKSTVPVRHRDGDQAQLRRARQGGGLRLRVHPEFLKEGSAIADFMDPDRVVVGAFRRERRRARGRALCAARGAVVLITTVPTAEMVKYASNAFLATKISFINEIANVCEEMGADVAVVAEGMGMDARIGAAFLRPGSASAARASRRTSGTQTAGRQLRLPLPAADRRDRGQRAAEAPRDRKAAAPPRRHSPASASTLLGLAFKPNTDDMREASSLVLAARLEAAGAGESAPMTRSPPITPETLLPRRPLRIDPHDGSCSATATRRCSSPSGPEIVDLDFDPRRRARCAATS